MIAAFLLAAFALSQGATAEEKKKIKPTQRWAGKSADEDKKKAAPKTGYLTSQEAFEKLWEAWALKDKAPKIDFEKQIIFVHLAGGPNNVSTTYTLDDKGNLKAVSLQTLIGGPGFGYGIDVLDRQGIKTYNGKPLEK
jgi:hypothetical protein